MAVGWRQFDTVTNNFRQAGVSWSDDGGRTWQPADILDRGNFRSDPVLASASDGTFYYYSLRGNLLCDIYTSYDGGQTWGEPVAAFGGDKQWLAVDRTGGMGQDNIYISWSTSSNPWGGERVFIRSTDRGLTFSEPQILSPAPIWGTLTTDPDGVLYLGGNAAFDLSEFVVHRSLDARDPTATEPTFDAFVVNMGGDQSYARGPNPGGLLGQMWLDVDWSDGPRRGRVYMLGSVNPPGSDPLDVHLVYSDDQAETWSEPIRVAFDDRGAWQWFGTFAVAPTGRLDVVWIESLDAARPEWGEMYWSRSFDGGLSWSDPVAVTPAFDSHVGWPNQNKMGDYYHMVSDAVGADLIYAATFNGEQDVWYLRLGSRDCDRNGTPDESDLAVGRLEDCNGNSLPDACEIAAGTATDSNSDGVIDACFVAPRRGGGRVGD
jgi:hypothetical protein